MKKMLVTKFENVLVDSDQTIPISTVISVDDLRRKNYVFSVISDMEISFVTFYTHDFNFIDYIICMDGSYVYDNENKKVLYESPLSIDLIKSLLKDYTDRKVTIYTDTTHHMYRGAKKVDFDILKHIKFYKIEVVFKDKKECLKHVKEIKTKYIVNTSMRYENREYICSIVNPGVSKYEALKMINRKEKIKLSDVTTISNNYDDLEIIKKVGTSVFSQGGVEEIKDKCDKETPSSDYLGVEKVIREILRG